MFPSGQKIVGVMAGREKRGLSSDDMQIVAGHQARVATGIGYFGFPPAVVLETDDCKNVTLREAKLLRDGCSVAVQCTSCEVGLER